MLPFITKKLLKNHGRHIFELQSTSRQTYEKTVSVLGSPLGQTNCKAEWDELINLVISFSEMQTVRERPW